MPKIIELETDLPGYLFRPKEEGVYPGVVFIHGSGGGSSNFINLPGAPPRPTGKEASFVKAAQAYAQKGFVSLAFSYFDFPSAKSTSMTPPFELVRIDIKQLTETAISQLRSLDCVDSSSVGLCGFSRGAEQSLLLASLTHPSSTGRPDFVVAISPTAHIWGGISKETAERFKQGETFEWPSVPAWCYDGVELPMNTEIALEKIDMPVLISTLTTDPVWNISNSHLDIQARWRKHGLAFTEVQLKDTKAPLSNTALPHSDRVLVTMEAEGHCAPDAHIYPHLDTAFKSLVCEFILHHSQSTNT